MVHAMFDIVLQTGRSDAVSSRCYRYSDTYSACCLDSLEWSGVDGWGWGSVDLMTSKVCNSCGVNWFCTHAFASESRTLQDR
jgi:hypothetical protein